MVIFYDDVIANGAIAIVVSEVPIKYIKIKLM